MSSITSAASTGTDKSMSALQLIYGAIATNPLSGGGTAGGATSGGLISQVFLVLNSCILAVGVIWAMYHFGSAMIATGQDGEFLGQKKSSPWFIIRMGVGFTGLVPMFGGYCGAQIIMLWGTMMGVGIANLAMSASISVLTSGGSLVAMPIVPEVTALSRSLFEANLCAASANQAVMNLPADASVNADNVQAEIFTANSSGSRVVLTNGNGLSCGGAEINANAADGASSSTTSMSGLNAYSNDMSGMQASLLTAQQNALATMQATLASAAQTYVSAVNSQTRPPDPQTTIDNAAQAYQQQIQTELSNENSAFAAMAHTIEANLTRDGWIMLGSWYQSFAQANTQLAELAAAVATAVTGTDPANLPYPQLYRSVMASYAQQIDEDASTTPADGSMSTARAIGNLSSGMNDPQSVLARTFPGKKLVQDLMVLMASGQGANGGLPLNPLMAMKSVGDDIIDAGGSMLATYASTGSDASDLGKLTAGISGMIGQKAASKPDQGPTLSALQPFVVAIVISLFFFGVMLSIYMPMLPFIVWFSGVISWFMVVAEAMVASPLWAMTHLDGDGDGLGQRTQHGYVFLLNVMLRPVFMVFGFLLAGASVVVLGMLLNSMFWVAMENAQYSSTRGIVMIIGFVVLYVGMCQTLCNTAFSLIHVIPDNVFSWIGAHMAGAGTGFEDKVRSGFDSSASQGRGDASQMRSGGKPPVHGPGSSAAGAAKGGAISGH
ncbi:hypothetical protein D7S89_15275 [Trinickia fusca]|uniref:Conjugal transfer protein TraY n=1 Tax=Trinickia fusca TaxID=2419777 RepID=A0A494XA43_9BURK|nr:hypothetical protein D7S89_15275 [Trinickia fusca]